jgi:hypothetical protein
MMRFPSLVIQFIGVTGTVGTRPFIPSLKLHFHLSA